MHILFGIVLLGLIVFFHELGHFAASRICGVKVESFSIGMGPVLLHKEKWGTDWRISLFPFGGYCAMKGEKDIDDEFLNAAFADVVELITAGNDAATNMSLAGVEEVITALDGIADMLSASLMISCVSGCSGAVSLSLVPDESSGVLMHNDNFKNRLPLSLL